VRLLSSFKLQREMRALCQERGKQSGRVFCTFQFNTVVRAAYSQERTRLANDARRGGIRIRAGKALKKNSVGNSPTPLRKTAQSVLFSVTIPSMFYIKFKLIKKFCRQK
jgi:hypothetical protein